MNEGQAPERAGLRAEKGGSRKAGILGNPRRKPHGRTQKWQIRTSLAVPWLRLRVSKAGSWVQLLVRESPMPCGIAKK